MEKVISLSDIKKHYKVGQQVVKALQTISIDVEQNEYVAIMGTSGSGKSTLMNIIGCLDTPTGGEYILSGHNVNGLTDSQLAEIRNKEIGFIFQTFNLLPRSSALDNVILPLIYAGVGKAERVRMATEALKNVGLEDRMMHRPNELSGGQRQRVAIARALVNQPSLLLADEPTGNLDSKTSVDIMRLMENIHQKGNTIILVTHENEIAEHAKRIIRLKDGLIESDEINENRIILN